jgi:hypothetical protein
MIPKIPNLPTFYMIAVAVASVVFLVAFFFVWLQYSARDKMYPPILTSCPDNWRVLRDGRCEIPVDAKNTGTMKGRQIYEYTFGNRKQYSLMASMYDPVSKQTYTGTEYNWRKGYYVDAIPFGYDSKHPQNGIVDFLDLGWASNGSSVCEKHRWAKSHSIAWDGISNYARCDV